MRNSIIIFTAFLVAAAACCSTGEEDYLALHQEALVWDCHNDLAYRVLYEGLDI